MKDDRGLFYYPYPQNHQVRMYVRRVGKDICFRLWDANDQSLWDTHGWMPYEAIRQATAIYTKSTPFDPQKAYDIVIANELLRREGERM